VFSKPEVKALLHNYIIVQLYTDVVPNHFYAPELVSTFGSSTSRQKQDATEVNFVFQDKAFPTVQLPLYAILEPQEDGRILVLSIYDEGRIINEAAFREFLRNPS
jgi:thiol:disulfide interchange protein DsbD